MDLPAAIPERLDVDVVDERGERLGGTTRIAVEAGLREGLAVYRFSTRLLLRLDDSQTVPTGTHVMRLQIYQGSVPDRPFSQAAGRMCGNIVLVQFTDDEAVLRLRFIHEFGHYFGLPHEEGTCATYLRTCELKPDPAADRYDSRQLEILGRWEHPESPYVPHWQNR